MNFEVTGTLKQMSAEKKTIFNFLNNLRLELDRTGANGIDSHVPITTRPGG